MGILSIFCGFALPKFWKFYHLDTLGDFLTRLIT